MAAAVATLSILVKIVSDQLMCRPTMTILPVALFGTWATAPPRILPR